MAHSSLWAQFDAMIFHSGKSPLENVHIEEVTNDARIIDLSRKNEEAKEPGLCRAFIFATGGATRGVFLAPESGRTCDQLSVAELFPNGAISIRVLEMPGTNRKLTNDWRIIISSGRAPAPANVAVQSNFDIPWEGNVVLACYHQLAPNRPKMNNVPLGLTPFIGLLLKSFLEMYLTYEKATGCDIEPPKLD